VTPVTPGVRRASGHLLCHAAAGSKHKPALLTPIALQTCPGDPEHGAERMLGEGRDAPEATGGTPEVLGSGERRGKTTGGPKDAQQKLYGLCGQMRPKRK